MGGLHGRHRIARRSIAVPCCHARHSAGRERPLQCEGRLGGGPRAAGAARLPPAVSIPWRQPSRAQRSPAAGSGLQPALAPRSSQRPSGVCSSQSALGGQADGAVRGRRVRGSITLQPPPPRGHCRRRPGSNPCIATHPPARRLVLEDGSVWHGFAFGHTGTEGAHCRTSHPAAAL